MFEGKNKSVNSYSGRSWLAVAILVAYLLLGGLYSVVTPLWESYDEWGHYPYVEYIATERALPRERLTDRNDETHQPPLYYILGALATFWVNTDDNPELVRNEYSVHQGGEGGINLHLHLENEEFPYRGTALAAHLTRLVSVLLGAVSVWATYVTSRTLFPARRGLALGAMAVNAFWPQLLFLSSVVTNDVMIIACGSLALLFLAKILAHNPSPLNLLGLGLSLCGGLLSKRNGLALLPFALVGLIVVSVRLVGVKKKRSAVTSFLLLGGGVLVLTGVALVSVWWWDSLRGRYQGHISRILSILSDPAQMTQLHWDRLPSSLYFCLATFFAAFGHLTLGVEAWIYRLMALICFVALLGLVAFLVNKRANCTTRFGIAILLLHLLAFLAAPAYRTLVARGGGAGPTVISSIQNGSPLLFEKNVFLFQGRFVLPAISSFSILLTLGLMNLVPDRFEGKLVMGMGVVLLSFAVLVPFRYVRPAYARPRLLPRSDVQGLEHPVHIQFGDKIELLGYEVENRDVTIGDKAAVTLYWHCLDEMEQNYPLILQILGPHAQIYGELRLHPGYGNFPTSLWEKGNIFRETYHISISPDAPTPSQAYIRVSFQGSDLPPLKPYDSQGNPIEVVLGYLVIRSQEQPEVKNPIHYKLGEQIALVGYEITTFPEEEGEVGVTLYWRALTAIDKNYTVFVHVLDESERLVAQEDRQPKNGLSPTSIWQAREIIEDEYRLSVPPEKQVGEYQIRVGMYELDTMERLPAFDGEGNRWPHDVIVLTGRGKKDELSNGEEEG